MKNKCEFHDTKVVTVLYDGRNRRRLGVHKRSKWSGHQREKEKKDISVTKRFISLK